MREKICVELVASILRESPLLTGRPLILLCSFPKVAREGLTLVQVVDALKLSSNVVVSAVVAEGDTASQDSVNNQALVRKAFDWHKWPLQGATFIPTESNEHKEGAGPPELVQMS